MEGLKNLHCSLKIQLYHVFLILISWLLVWYPWPNLILIFTVQFAAAPCPLQSMWHLATFLNFCLTVAFASAVFFSFQSMALWNYFSSDFTKCLLCGYWVESEAKSTCCCTKHCLIACLFDFNWKVFRVQIKLKWTRRVLDFPGNSPVKCKAD